MRTKTKLLLLGSGSFLGSSLVRKLGGISGGELAIDAIGRAQIDLASPSASEAIRNLLRENAYQYVVLCAAVTDVSQCHRDPAGSFLTNVRGTKAVLDACREHRAHPLFFSSDYVFGRESRPAAEDSPRRPETVYGQQKAEIEAYLESSFDRYAIFRTSKLMSRHAHPRNILWQVFAGLAQGKRVPSFVDQWINGVFIEDIASAVAAVVSANATGIFHLGTRSVLTRFEIATMIAERFRLDPRLIEPIRLADLNFPEPRAHHNTLDCRRTADRLGLQFSELTEALPGIDWSPAIVMSNNKT